MVFKTIFLWPYSPNKGVKNTFQEQFANHWSLRLKQTFQKCRRWPCRTSSLGPRTKPGTKTKGCNVTRESRGLENRPNTTTRF